jgi:amino acid transporter
VNAWLNGTAFEITMFSGMVWSMTQSDVIVAAAMGLLFTEILKSVGTPMLSLVNHGIAVMTLLIYSVQFMSIPGFTTSAFFLLGLMQLIDVIAGYTITIVATRGLTR